jgi:hypothetical protein
MCDSSREGGRTEEALSRYPDEGSLTKETLEPETAVYVTKTKWPGSLNRFVLTIEDLKLKRKEKRSKLQNAFSILILARLFRLV